MKCYLQGIYASVVLEPVDGPPIDIPFVAMYVTDVGRRVAFIEYAHNTEMSGRIRRGQMARLVIREPEGGEDFDIGPAVVSVYSRECTACSAIRGVIVVTELEKG